MSMRILAVGLVAAVVAGLACGKAADAEGGPPGGGGGQQMPPPEVSVVTIGTQRIALTTELPGRTTPFLVAEVRPQVGGLVMQRLFAEGADVKAGDVLYQIDPASYEVALSMARATLARAEAGLSTTATRSRRFEALAEGNAVSKQERDDASGGVRASKADVAAARAAVDARVAAAAKPEVETSKVPAAAKQAKRVVAEVTDADDGDDDEGDAPDGSKGSAGGGSRKRGTRRGKRRP